jgi:hypothetical protein
VSNRLGMFHSPTDKMFVVFVCRVEDDIQKIFLIRRSHLRVGNGVLHRDTPEVFTGSFVAIIFSSTTLYRQSSPRSYTLGHGVAFCPQNLGKPRFAFVDQVEFVKLIVLGHAPILSIHLELVKVAVGPAHHDLECVVQTAEENRARNMNLPPDQWFNAEEREPQLVGGRRCLCRRHKDISTKRASRGSVCKGS